MGALDFLKDIQGKVVDAATYQLLSAISSCRPTTTDSSERRRNCSSRRSKHQPQRLSRLEKDECEPETAGRSRAEGGGIPNLQVDGFQEEA